MKETGTNIASEDRAHKILKAISEFDRRPIKTTLTIVAEEAAKSRGIDIASSNLGQALAQELSIQLAQARSTIEQMRASHEGQINLLHSDIDNKDAAIDSLEAKIKELEMKLDSKLSPEQKLRAGDVANKQKEIDELNDKYEALEQRHDMTLDLLADAEAKLASKNKDHAKDIEALKEVQMEEIKRLKAEHAAGVTSDDNSSEKTDYGQDLSKLPKPGDVIKGPMEDPMEKWRQENNKPAKGKPSNS